MITALTHWYSGFLRRRRAQKHFGRHPLTNLLAGRGPVPPAPEPLALDLLLAARDQPAAAIARLASHPDGLSAREAAARVARDGPNEVDHEKPVPWWLHLWHCYKNPFNLLLTVLAVVSYLSADAKATIVIGAMVVLSTLIRFVQEGRSHRAAENLRAMVRNTTTVIRRDAVAKGDAAHVASRQIDVPIRKLAAGDLIVLSAGDMTPADCRVVAAKDLFISQAAMTGESLPVEKFADHRGESNEPLEQSNLVFMGTNVVSGSATHCRIKNATRADLLPHVICYPSDCPAGAEQRDEANQHDNAQGVGRSSAGAVSLRGVR